MTGVRKNGCMPYVAAVFPALLLAVSGLLCAAVDAAAADADAAGYVEALQGTVSASHPTRGDRSLALESPVYAGDTVSTGAGAAARLVFMDESTLELRENSRFQLSGYDFDPDDDSACRMLVKFSKGVFRTVTGAIVKRNPERFKLSAPLASVGIRGTEIGSRVEGGGELHALLSGTPIEVAGKVGGPEVVARADYGVDVSPGKPVSKPRELTEAEKKLFMKMAFTRQMDGMRRQMFIKGRVSPSRMVRPKPGPRPHHF